MRLQKILDINEASTKDSRSKTDRGDSNSTNSISDETAEWRFESLKEQLG